MILEYIEIKTQHPANIMQMFLDILECHVDLQTGLINVGDFNIQLIEVDDPREITKGMTLSFFIKENVADAFFRKFELFQLKRKISKDIFTLFTKGSSFHILDNENRTWKFISTSDVNLI